MAAVDLLAPVNQDGLHSSGSSLHAADQLGALVFGEMNGRHEGLAAMLVGANRDSVSRAVLHRSHIK